MNRFVTRMRRTVCIPLPTMFLVAVSALIAPIAPTFAAENIVQSTQPYTDTFIIPIGPEAACFGFTGMVAGSETGVDRITEFVAGPNTGKFSVVEDFSGTGTGFADNSTLPTFTGSYQGHSEFQGDDNGNAKLTRNARVINTLADGSTVTFILHFRILVKDGVVIRDGVTATCTK
jgi:hypothetical protein